MQCFTCRFQIRFSAERSRSVAGRTSKTKPGNMRGFGRDSLRFQRLRLSLISPSQAFVLPFNHRYPYGITGWSTSNRMHDYFREATPQTPRKHLPRNLSIPKSE